jgi:hypothetical protein
MRFSTHGKALSGSIQGHGSGPFASRVNRSAMVRSARCRPARNTQGVFAYPVGDHRALLQLEVERSADQLLRHFEQLLGQRYQLVRRQTAMALVHCFGQGVGNPRTNPDHRRLFDAELHGDRVDGLETNATNIAREPVRVLGHHLDGIGAIGLEDPHRSRGADTVAVQKDHDFSHGLLFGPSRENASRANRPDAVDLAQPVGCGLDNFEHFLAKGADEFLGVDRPYATDHAGRQIFFDAIG